MSLIQLGIGITALPVIWWIIISALQRLHTFLTDSELYTQIVATPLRQFLYWYHKWSYRRVPDWIYRLWYRTGVMPADVYHRYQDEGIISHDLDPEYLQQRSFVDTEKDAHQDND